MSAVRSSRLATLALVAVLISACSSGGGPILANPTLALPVPATATPPAPNPADPVPIVFPRDDGPHDRLTEWWYYTGHLTTDDGRHFGFEAVIFRAERGDVPVTWASHLALTDESGNRFLYAQRSEIGPQVDRSPRDARGNPTGFDLAVTGQGGAPEAPATPWDLRGGNGQDSISASAGAAEAGTAFGLDLSVSALKRPALHMGDGWVPFGPAGGSYYYSRTRMAASGTLMLDGKAIPVHGIAWFDHQWGDFISVGGGGWDWFAVNLDNGDDFTISRVRAADGTTVLTYGTYVHANGDAASIAIFAGTINTTGSWTSPHTGATYPAGWALIPDPSLAPGLGAVHLDPTLADQELDTRATTGVIYWEGSQRVTATERLGTVQLGGDAYVELTGYAPPAGLPGASTPEMPATPAPSP